MINNQNVELLLVLSPSRVQTKFEENSLPARSNIVSKKSFTCVILKNYFLEPFFNSRFSRLQKYGADDFKLFYPR